MAGDDLAVDLASGTLEMSLSAGRAERASPTASRPFRGRELDQSCGPLHLRRPHCGPYSANTTSSRWSIAHCASATELDPLSVA
jgi:hypothetical protein